MPWTLTAPTSNCTSPPQGSNSNPNKMQAKDLFSLTRTKPDGRHGLGFGVILLVMLVCIVGGLYVIKVVKWAPKREPGVKIATPSSDNVRRGGNPVEKPFVLINSLDSTPTSQQSSGSLESAYRQAELQNAEAKSNEPTNDSSQGWIPVVHPKDMPTDSQSAPNQPGQGHLTTDPMVHRGSRQPAPRNPFGPRGSQGYGSGPLNLDSPYGPNIAEGQPTEGVKYYYVSDLVVLGTPAAAGQSNRSGFLTRHFLPRGYKIPVILINQINTSVGALPVEMSIAKDVEFNGKLQVPFGWKIFGTAQAGTGIKVNVKANMILDPLGREYPINGLVLDTQQEPGFDGYPTPSPLLMQLLPIAQQTMSTFISAAQDVVTQPTLVSGGGIGGSNLVANSQVYALDAKNAMLQGTAQVLSGLMAQKTAELQQALSRRRNRAPRHARLPSGNHAAGSEHGHDCRQHELPFQGGSDSNPQLDFHQGPAAVQRIGPAGHWKGQPDVEPGAKRRSGDEQLGAASPRFVCSNAAGPDNIHITERLRITLARL